MPFVTVTATPTFSAEQKKALMTRTSSTVVDVLGSKKQSVRVTLHELSEGHYLCGDSFSTPTVMFEVDLIAGRTEEAKAALIAQLGKIAHETTGVPESEVRARITDLPNTNVGMENGVTAKMAGR